MINSLLHKQPVALDRNDHRFMRLRRPVSDWSVAAKLNSVFVAAVEFGDVAREYPIVFVRAGDGADGKPDIAPLAVLGMQQQENLFVDGGKWRALYQPAVVRVYPFAIGRLSEERFAICFDAACPDLSGSEGEPLFAADGQQSALMNEVQGRLETLEAEIQRTKTMCHALRDMDLLLDMRYDATLPDGSQLALDGFLTVDNNKLNDLNAEQVLTLHKSGVLGMVHAHNLSMGNMGKLLDWHLQRLPAGAAAPA